METTIRHLTEKELDAIQRLREVCLKYGFEELSPDTVEEEKGVEIIARFVKGFGRCMKKPS